MPCLVRLCTNRLTRKWCPSISQRHFLLVMCMLGLLLTTLNSMAFFYLMSEYLYGDRPGVGLSHHTVCPSIIAPIHANYTHGHEEFMWGSRAVGYIILARTFGTFLGRLPAGMIVDKCGSKTLYGYSVFVPAICSLLTPLCARTSPYVIMANRIVMGIFASAQLPAMAWFVSRWFPRSQVCRMLALLSLGFPVACIIRIHLATLIFQITDTWTNLYYSIGIISLIWTYVWQAYTWDDPFRHPYITEEELELLSHKSPVYANDNEMNQEWSWPWKAILSSCPVWSLALAYLGYSWFVNYSTVILAAFFNGVHKYNFERHPFVFTYLYMLMALFMVAAGAINDFFMNNGVFTTTHITKANYAIGSIIGAMFILGVSSAGCKTTEAVMYSLGAFACVGVAFNTHLPACIRVAPNFVGTIIGVTTVLGEGTTFLQLHIVFQITSHPSLKSWNAAALINAVACIFSTAVFLKAGRCALEPWNHPERKMKSKKPLFKWFRKGRSPQPHAPLTTQSLPAMNGKDVLEDDVVVRPGRRTSR